MLPCRSYLEQYFQFAFQDLRKVKIIPRDPVRVQNRENPLASHGFEYPGMSFRGSTTIYGSKDFLDGSSIIKKLTLHVV